MLKSYRWHGWVGWLAPKIFSPWHFDNGDSSKIDDVLAEDGGLLHVLPLAVHLKALLNSYGWVGWPTGFYCQPLSPFGFFEFVDLLFLGGV